MEAVLPCPQLLRRLLALALALQQLQVQLLSGNFCSSCVIQVFSVISEYHIPLRAAAGAAGGAAAAEGAGGGAGPAAALQRRRPALLPGCWRCEHRMKDSHDAGHHV